MDPAALRRLDRVDTLVVEADVIASDVWQIAAVVSFTATSDGVQDSARAKLEALVSVQREPAPPAVKMLLEAFLARVLAHDVNLLFDRACARAIAEA